MSPAREVDMTGTVDNSGTPKITKACSRCRRLKVRCVRSDPTDNHSPCKRCLKGKRECKMDVSKRRRQHTIPPSAVASADTPPKINTNLKQDSLNSAPTSASIAFSPLSMGVSSTLNGVESSGGIGTNSSANSTTAGLTPPGTINGHTGKSVGNGTNEGNTSLTPQALTGHQNHQSTSTLRKPQGYYNTRASPSVNVIAVREQIMSSWRTLTELDSERLDCIEKKPYKYIARPENNAIAQGFISRGEAVRRLDIYRNYVFPRFPIVHIPDAPLEDIINQTPILFHCILDVTSQTIQDHSQRRMNMILHNMAYTTVIQEIMITSTKSLELLQCLVILTYWYNESEFYHRQRMFSLSTLAVSLAYDLGIGGSLPPGSSNAPIFEQIVTPQAAVDPSSLQCRLVWLSVYVLSFEYTSSNRRPVTSYFNTYTRESIDIISKAMAKNSDMDSYHIWHLAPIVHLLEEVTVQLFKTNNESSAPNMADATVQYLIHHFDREIDNLCATLPYTGSTKMALLVLRAYLHQSSLYCPFDPDLGRSPFTNFSLNVNGQVNMQGARSFKTCYLSASEVLDMVQPFDIDYLSIITMPIWNMIVLSCAIVLKCRALCIFNRSYADACFVPETVLVKIMSIIEKVNTLFDKYPSSNIATSCNFLLKLLVCHNDARTHFWASSAGNVPLESLGDPDFVTAVRSGVQESDHLGALVNGNVGNVGSNVNTPNDEMSDRNGAGTPSVPPSTAQDRIPATLSPASAPSRPVSPSSSGHAADVSQLNASSPTSNVGTSNIPPSRTARQMSNGGLYRNPVTGHVANAGYHHRPSLTPLERELALQQLPPRGGRRISLSFLSEDYPLWQLSDDFWRDIIPNEGSFGFDF